jgi:hypothetical protein
MLNNVKHIVRIIQDVGLDWFLLISRIGIVWGVVILGVSRE